jgi:L-lactate dehydrogenase complex protein LldG
VECEPEGLAASIEAQLAASGRHTFVVPAGLPAEWRAMGFEWKVDGDLPVDEIEHSDGVVTACFCGVAESGTIVLHHSAAEGRRVLSLLPDWHLCVVKASQIVETLPEYFDRCLETGNEGTRGQGNERTGDQGTKGARERATPSSRDHSMGTPAGNERTGSEGAGTLPRLVTWISGPSATADIEMTRIKGVHGPRYLHVVVVRDVESS